MGDIQLDADLIATTNNNNNSFDVIDRNGGSRRIANGDQVDGTSSNGLTITASTSNSSPNSGGKLINIGKQDRHKNGSGNTQFVFSFFSHYPCHKLVNCNRVLDFLPVNNFH